MKREPKMRHFRAVFDSHPSLFAPKPNGNACYAGYLRRCCLSSLINKKAECLRAEGNWVWAEGKKAKGQAMTNETSSFLKIYSMANEEKAWDANADDRHTNGKETVAVDCLIFYWLRPLSFPETETVADIYFFLLCSPHGKKNRRSGRCQPRSPNW